MTDQQDRRLFARLRKEAKYWRRSAETASRAMQYDAWIERAELLERAAELAELHEEWKAARERTCIHDDALVAYDAALRNLAAFNGDQP